MPINAVTSKLYNRVIKERGGEVNALGEATRTFYARNWDVFVEQKVNTVGGFITNTQKYGREAKTIKKTVVSDKASIFETWDKLKHKGKHITRVILSPDSYIQRELSQIAKGTVDNKGMVMLYKRGESPIPLDTVNLNGVTSPTSLLNDGFIKKYSKGM